MCELLKFLIICTIYFQTNNASQGRVNLIPTQAQQIFEFSNTVTMSSYQHAIKSEQTAYTFKSLLKVNSVWNSAKSQLLEIHFTDTTINAPTNNRQSVSHEIESVSARPFYVSIVDGIAHKVIAHTSRDQSLLNLKRSIASLLLLQHTNVPIQELDVSGQCNTFYATKSSTRIEKTKTDCSHWDLRVNYRTEKPLGVSQHSQQKINFDLSADGMLTSVDSKETHSIALTANPDIGSQVVSELTLKHIRLGEDYLDQLNYGSLDEAIQSLLDWYRVFDIEADVDGSISEIKQTTLSDEIEKHKKDLSNEYIGKEIQALTIAQLVPLARITKEAEFVKILRDQTDLHAQLVDILGAVQTSDAYNAIHEVFHYNNNAHTDLLEKYLQSLSIGIHPERTIIENLLSRIQNNTAPINSRKLYESAVLTLAALTKHSEFDQNDPLLNEITTFLLQSLNDKCGKDVTCKCLYIRALQNLQNEKTISTLIRYATNGDVKLSVSAMLALRNFPLVLFNESHRKIFSQIFYQKKRKYDTTARVVAIDVLMSLKPTQEQLGHLLEYLASNDKHYEIKTYVIQKIRMLAEKCPRFSALLRASLAERAEINNYHVIAQKGLTTVLGRQLSLSPTFNESLLSVQEIYKGILKRGTVEILLSAERDEMSTFKLGLYTGGLSSFVSDSDDDDGANDGFKDDDDLDEDSTATAGMEISVQNVLLRPLVFFTGQSELMGHVWSGTASELTPAYQATILTQDHEHYIILSSGATVYISIIGTQSINLSGKVEFSIWNRNANTEIIQNSGNAIVGSMVAGFTYAKVANKFIITTEPNLSLTADVDFYSGIKLCMQLQRSQSNFTHSNTRTVELTAQPPFYKKRVISRRDHKTAGSTLALNQKNNEMCNMIFNN